MIVPHNDREGQVHAVKVAYSVQGVAKSVRVLELSGLPEGGGDISDWLDQGHTAQELMELARNAPEWETPEKQEAPQGVLRFQSAADIARETPQDTQWIVRPIVPSEAIVEVSGKVKVAGKTTFLMAMSRKVLGGLDFMGEPTRQTPVVYLTEQPRSSLREALRRADLLDREDFRILRYSDTIGTPWPRVVEAAAKECKRVGAKLLVVDTLPQFAGIRDDEENSTGAALEALEPIQAVVAMGTAVVVIRHDGKADRNVGDSARGASQWSGVPDIIISVRRGEGNSSPTVRVLHTISRLDETPDKLVIDLQGGEYVSLGTETRVAILVAKEALLSGAPISEESAVDANKLIEEADGVKPTVGNQAISELVQEGKLLRRGAGKRGDARRYWNPESIHPLIGNTVPNELNIGGTTSAGRADQPSGGDSNTPALIDSFATTTLYTDESINDAVEEGEI